jgi:glycine cleavage system H protein
VKAASDVYAPIAGDVVAVNEGVTGAPETLNENAYAAWLFRLKPSDPGALAKMLDAADYEKLLA